ncbi:hypothetical protein Nmel_000537, partial [Mimus melanotis]
MEIPSTRTGRGRSNTAYSTESDSSRSGSSPKEDEITAALNRQRRGKIVRRAIRERSPVAKHIRSKRQKNRRTSSTSPVTASSQQPGANIYKDSILPCRNTTVGKYKKNADKVGNLIKRAINTQNPDWTDLKSMMDTLLDSTERQVVNKAITTSEKSGEIPIEVENVVNPVVLASDIPGGSKWAESVRMALRPEATL